ncbi:MAG: transketolase [Candidatus Aminicenantes bacterium]|nr:transketolase [Candidatus Aminicenantes bacterium]
MNKTEFERLSEIARQIRIHIIKMLAAAGSGHPGGSLSIAEILAYLYFKEMRIDPQNPAKIDRDRFVLSKGHAAPALYASLALRGYFPVPDLLSLRQIASHLQGHPHRIDTPGVEASTGSLGQGLSIAVGMAIGNRISGIDAQIFSIIGDGESQEGQIWEAAMTAGFHRLADLCVFFDYNDLQIDGKVSQIKDIYPVKEKWQAFRWHVLEIDGHNLEEIENAVNSFKAEKQKPTLVIAHTTKGKGVSFMENGVDWHGVAPTKEEAEIALQELQKESNNG